jgi:hypothetical protein
MEFKVYANHNGACYGATIHVGELTCNATTDRYGNSIAFVQGESGKWRATEWFGVPEEVQDALFDKAEAKSLKVKV